MPYQFLTCPETGHLELIECDENPLGLLVLECSRFRPPREIACPRTCAARLDRRDRCRVGEDTLVDASTVRRRAL
jgi:hypothetical protein